MTKKDFELIASVLASVMIILEDDEDKEKSLVQHIANRFAGVLAQENPRFDRQKFLKACGVVER